MKNISKSGYWFAFASSLADTLAQIDKMPQNTLDEIIEKYAIDYSYYYEEN